MSTNGQQRLRQAPRSRAFLLEMLLNMLIFALCAVVTLQLFAVAKTTIDQSHALTRLSIEAESLAESFKAVDGQVDALEELLGEDLGSDLVLTRYYDSELAPAAAEAAAYTLECHLGPKDGLAAATITASSGPEQLLSIEVLCPTPWEDVR
jgi:hypothetical protein